VLRYGWGCPIIFFSVVIEGGKKTKQNSGQDPRLSPFFYLLHINLLGKTTQPLG
jgi:hypothetical protein